MAATIDRKCVHQDFLRRKWRVLASLYGRVTVQFLYQKTLDFISPDLWLMQERVYIVQTPVRDTSRSLWPATWSSSHWHGQAYHETSATKQLVNGESGYKSMKAKWHHFEHLLNWNRLFSEPTHYTTGGSVDCWQIHQQSTEENMLFRVMSVAAIYEQIK